MKAQTEFVQVSTTTDTETNAKRIARKLLERRVASCVQVFGPVKSSYQWKGNIEHANEWFCLIKARTKDYQKIERVIKNEHPYEVPEIIAIPIVSGNLDYLRWIREETTRRRSTHA